MTIWNGVRRGNGEDATCDDLAAQKPGSSALLASIAESRIIDPEQGLCSALECDSATANLILPTATL